MAGATKTSGDVLEIRAAEPFGEGKRVDAASGLVRGVKILGRRSANRYRGLPARYADQAIARAVPLYEGAPVYLDHPANRQAGAERSYKDRFGRLENVRVQADGLYGDLRVNPKHPRADQFLWDAEHNSKGMGLSHNALITGSPQGDEFVFESIDRVRSVDVVTQPATTMGLFESLNPEERNMSGTTANPAAPAAQPAAGAAPSAASASSTPATCPAGCAPTSGQSVTESRNPEGEQVDALESRILARLESRFGEQIKKLEREKDELTVQLAGRAKAERVQALILESRLPAHAVTEVFRAQLLEAKDEAAMKALLDDRKKIAWHQAPGAPPTSAGAKPIVTQDDFLESVGG